MLNYSTSPLSKTFFLLYAVIIPLAFYYNCVQKKDMDLLCICYSAEMCHQSEKSHLEDDEFAFEYSQEVARLLSHDHPDLYRSSIVLVINIDGLEGASCDLIFSGMTALMQDRHEIKLILFSIYQS